ncbi:MAG: response regulator [Opitutaceae bacterium]
MAAPAPPARLLVVDDDEGLLLLMAGRLREEGYVVATAPSAREARARLAAGAPDLLFLDLKLADGSGPDLAAELRRERQAVPFVVVTGKGDERAAVEVMRQGALDYVMKDTSLLDRLPAVAERALHAVAQDQALRAAQAEHRRLERELVAISERERHSIGADLHDNLGQQLTALELMCTLAKTEAAPHPALTRRLDQMARMLREAITQVRFLARGLVPVGPGPDSLQVGLAELAERTSALGRPRCRLECPEPIAVTDSFLAGHLYRIAQEAVNNAVKHARAGEVVIRLLRRDGALLLAVEDDGTGLSRGKGASPEGIGLSVMRHRANAIGAVLAVDSRRSGGVSVRCSLPSTP